MRAVADMYSLPPPLGDRDVLARSTAKDGKNIEPVTLYEGELLDGRNRYQVANNRGIPRWAIDFEQVEEGKAVQSSKEALDGAARRYVCQKNVVRRHQGQ